MKTEEFNLSDKRGFYPIGFLYHQKDVKEFIRLLKYEIISTRRFSLDEALKASSRDRDILILIDKLAGEKLNGH